MYFVDGIMFLISEPILIKKVMEMVALALVPKIQRWPMLGMKQELIAEGLLVKILLDQEKNGNEVLFSILERSFSSNRVLSQYEFIKRSKNEQKYIMIVLFVWSWPLVLHNQNKQVKLT